jgi:DNA-binding transcriptional MerR regulator
MSIKNPLPDKMYYSIGEVAGYFGVSTSLIRYWEDEFPQITPRKNGKGDRRYTKQDIEKVTIIYDLIKEKGFTIKGAQSHLSEKSEKSGADQNSSLETIESLKQIKGFLLQLKSNLKNL